MFTTSTCSVSPAGAVEDVQPRAASTARPVSTCFIEASHVDARGSFIRASTTQRPECFPSTRRLTDCAQAAAPSSNVHKHNCNRSHTDTSADLLGTGAASFKRVLGGGTTTYRFEWDGRRST